MYLLFFIYMVPHEDLGLKWRFHSATAIDVRRHRIHCIIVPAAHTSGGQTSTHFRLQSFYRRLNTRNENAASSLTDDNNNNI